MTIMRATLHWTGFTGGPGYTNLYFGSGGGLISDAGQVLDRVETAVGEVIALLPNGTRIEIESEVAYIDEATGALESYEDTGEDRAWTSNTTGAYSGASGAVINWRTDDVRGNRRIRGRTFIVPLVTACYDNSGTLTTEALTSLRSFAETLTNWDLDSELMVWARPINGAGGVGATVTGFNVPDMAAVLRSRRD